MTGWISPTLSYRNRWKISGAPSAPKDPWQSKDWKVIESEVRRLQVRIAKAHREGKPAKAKALQWLLTHSRNAKLLAVKRVTSNQGAKTPGVDNSVWRTPKEKMQAVNSLTRAGYKAQPLKRIYIPKKQQGKLRPLSIPVMKCRAQQALHLLALEPISETIADKNSYGFRPKRSTTDALEQCFIALSRSCCAQYVLEGDIKSCFDKISHPWLMKHVPMDKRMLEKWLSAGYIEKGNLYSTQVGTPQGGIISPTLLNVTLSGLEAAVKAAAGLRDKVNVIVYADDFIITGRSREILENKIKPRVESFLKARGLELSQEKTHITHINEGFDFLGVNVRKYKDGKLILKPAKDNTKRFLDNIRNTVKQNQAAPTVKLIQLLNLKITGWANYHRYFCSKQTFAYVSRKIFQILWRWARKRHRRKGARWVKKKYFRTIGNNRWRFSTKIKAGAEEVKHLDLVEISHTPIRRHVKIRSVATPYDPAYNEYFQRRQDRRKSGKLLRPCKSQWSAWWALEPGIV